MISFAQFKRFAAKAAEQRQALWPATVTVGESTAALTVSKSPTRIERVPARHGNGFTTRHLATFIFPSTLTPAPDTSTRFALATCPPSPDEVGTRWMVMSMNPGADGAQSTVCLCQRLN